MFRHILLSLHLLSAVVWVGGMFFAHFCLRPAALDVLLPPQRLALWAATLKRFLFFVAVAVTVLLATGLELIHQAGFLSAPLGWHVMAVLGVLMACVFTYIYAILFPKFIAHCERSAWVDAGQVQNKIRQLVSLNLAIGTVVMIAAAVAG